MIPEAAHPLLWQTSWETVHAVMPELGNFALMLALCLACVQSLLPLAGCWKNRPRWMAVAGPAATGQCCFLLLAFATLLEAFIANDFSVAYVAANSNRALPLYYRIAAVWAGHEGSLLLWTLILSLWSCAVARSVRRLPTSMATDAARMLAVLGLLGIGFLSFMLLTSNPFARVLPAAGEGRDLNPLLQDIGMILHPPLLYMGYVGFAVPFACAIAALLGGRLDPAWVRWARPWTLAAWSFLTLGILLGSFWAYYELGWGGWWFWDAVENASFMPWLVGTALNHTLSVTARRGDFKTWTLLLAIVAFSLSLLGTFLVRSGVLSSVHAFAADPQRGLFILLFLSLTTGGSLLLYAWRAPQLGGDAPFSPWSRVSLLLVNNVLLLTAAATVLLGTLYPLLLDALGLGKISVGPPYFETVFVPLTMPLLLLMAAGPFVPWKNTSFKATLRQLRLPAALALAGAVAGRLHFGLSFAATAGLALALWILLATAAHPVRRRPAAAVVDHEQSVRRRLFGRRRGGGYWGMIIAHAGIGVFVIGVTLVGALQTADDVRMLVGDSVVLGDYRYRFSALRQRQGVNFIAARATFLVTDATDAGSPPTTVLFPEKRYFKRQDMPMTEAAIDRGLTRDLYVSLGEAGQDGAWSVRVQHKPFVDWIWAGCLMMALGGMLAAFARRRKTG